MLIAVLVHQYVGVKTIDFILVILIMVIVTMLLGWENTLSINVVIAVHLFMQMQAFTPGLIWNETKRVIIGMTVAILVNWKHFNRDKRFEQLVIDVEESLREILLNYAEFLKNKLTIEELQPQLDKYVKMVHDGTKETFLYANNSLQQYAKYYMNYMSMREKELVVLENVDGMFKQFHKLSSRTELLAERLVEIAADVPVRSSMEHWLLSFDAMKKDLEEEKLPENKEDFEDAAAVLFIIRELQQMIHIKQEFLNALTDKQMKRYLHDE